MRRAHADYLEINYNRIQGFALSADLMPVEDGTVRARTEHGEKITQLRGTNAIWAAGSLLRQLAAEGA
jgi:hypothetical protein